MAIDAALHVVVAGSTGRLDFPVTVGVPETLVLPDYRGATGFITELDATGGALRYSTLLGDPTQPAALAVDGTGTVYVAGASSLFPATVNAQKKPGFGTTYAFVAKISESTCIPSLSPSSASLDVNGGNVQVAITADPGCSWVVVSPSYWAKPVSASSGVGNGTVTINVPVNSSNPRTDTVSIAGSPFFVSQASNCTYSVAYTAQPPPASGGAAGSFSVTSPPTCGITASTNAAWLQVGYFGNPGQVYGNLQASPNFGASARSAIVTIADRSFTITQPGNYVCSYVVGSLAQPVGISGGDFSVSVTTASGCNWTATANDSWLRIISVYPTTESGTVTVEVSPNTGVLGNPGTPRTGTLTIAGQTFSITQAGASATSVSPSSGTGSSQAFTFTYTDPAGYQDISGSQIVINSTPQRRRRLLHSVWPRQQRHCAG